MRLERYRYTLVSMLEEISRQLYLYLLPIVLLLDFIAASAVTCHAILNKRDTSAIIAWVGLAWLAPLLGSLAYLLLGINRVHRRGAALKLRNAWQGRKAFALTRADSKQQLEFLAQYPQLNGHIRLIEVLSGHELLPGNQIDLLHNGDQAFPAMLTAINDAKCSISLLSYIFDFDRAGAAFVAALLAAQRRGVEVRVLVDGVGARYSRVNIVRKLRCAGVTAALFLPPRAPRLLGHANLRNHRKILVIDGVLGFTGGTNIREAHVLDWATDAPVVCTHFRCQGPVIQHLQEIFCIDWAFTTGESLSGPIWFPSQQRHGSSWARGIADGPDEDLNKLTYTLMGALSMARHRVQILTPYFIPNEALVYALQLAALRGVKVDILLPERSNIRLVDWAARPGLYYLLEKGCRIHLSPAPFDHSKLLLVDDIWVLLGSTNWDARSLRLNFEFNMECYDGALAIQLRKLIEERIDSARTLQLEDLNRLSLLIKLRNGLARLFSPYL